MSLLLGYLDVREFGAVGDGTTDDLAAFSSAVTAMAASGSRGNTLFVPRGVWRLSGPLYLHRQMILEGVSGAGDNAGTRLLFDAGQHGIIVTRGGGGLGAGDWTVIRDVGVISAAKSGATDGIRLEARASVENCLVQGWSRYGIAVDSTGNLGDNCNNFRLDHCRVEGCTSHGVYIDGADANAGLIVGVDSSSHTNGWAFYDNSFLGNTYVGCHAANCFLGAYKVAQSTASGVLLGCYSESGQIASELANGTIVLGGAHGAGFNSAYGACRIFPFGIGGQSVLTWPYGASGVDSYFALGSVDPNTAAIFTARTAANPDARLYFSNRPPFAGSLKGSTEWLSWNVGGAATHRTLLGFARSSIPGSGNHRPRVAGVGVSMFNDFFMGTGDGAQEGTVGTGSIKIAARDAVPTSGQWHRGDRVLNSNPTAGGDSGWVCTDGGTAGTYTEGRTATADGTTSVALNGISDVIFVGDRLTINGVTAYVANINTIVGGCSLLTMSDAVTAGSGLAVAYANPTFKAFGSIAA